ncbi:MAG: F0F1 ATP synthase subunit A [Thermomicrobiales bacterium]|nr:F0F1 ATP synthase subunit A [Thermomicrobiales bacterium]MCO5222412.1 F0F1 ATP synthase subunit A [Thermomicrobiales bacterium]
MEVHIELAAEELFKVGPLSVTNSMFMMFVVMAIILIVFWWVGRNVKMVPGRFQAAVEMLVELLSGLTEGSGGKAFGRKVFPLVSGLFIFILFANYTGLLPGVGTIGIERTVGGDEHASTAVIAAGTADGGQALYSTAATEEEGAHEVLVPILRPPTADLNMTLAMAIVSFTAIQYYGIKSHGVGGRIKHMANPPFLFPIEVIGEFSRIISLSARLFGNVFAGEALLGVMYAITAKIGFLVIPVLVPVVFLFLELMFGTIQALVFAMLTLVYIAIAAAHDHGDDSHEEHAEATGLAPTASEYPRAVGD